MIHYYQETNGDFLAIDTRTNRFYRAVFGKDHFEGRAPAVAGHVCSVCPTGVSRQFLKEKCRAAAKNQVPAKWRQAIGY